MSASSYSVGELIKYGVTLAQEHRYSDATKAFTKVIQLNDQEEKAYYLRGHARVKLKEYDGAIRDFKRTISLNRENAQAFYFLGMLLAQTEDLAKALWCLEEAMNLGYAEAIPQVARLQQRLQVRERALAQTVMENSLSTAVPSLLNSDEGLPLLRPAPPVVAQEATSNNGLSNGKKAEATDLIDIAADMLKKFAKKYCGDRIEMRETIKKGLFGLGKKVEEKVVRWRVRVKKSLADDHTGLLGEKILGASLEISREPITLIRVYLFSSTVYRVELQVEKDVGGMLKHQLSGLATVWKKEVPATADSLHDALQILLSTPYLTQKEGHLVYQEA